MKYKKNYLKKKKDIKRKLRNTNILNIEALKKELQRMNIYYKGCKELVKHFSA